MEELLAEFVEVDLLGIAELDALRDLLEVCKLHLQLLCLRIVKGRLEHQCRVGQQVHALSIAEVLRPVSRQLLAKLLHDSVDLLALTRNSKSVQQDLEGVDELYVWVREVQLIDVAREYVLIELVCLTQVLANLRRAQGKRLLQEPTSLLDLQFPWFLHHVSFLLQVLEPILRLQVELARCLAHLRLEHPILHLLLRIHGLSRRHLLITWLMLLQAYGVATCILISFVPGLQLSDEIGSLLLALRQPGLRQCLQLDGRLYRPVQVV